MNVEVTLFLLATIGEAEASKAVMRRPEEEASKCWTKMWRAMTNLIIGLVNRFLGCQIDQVLKHIDLS